MCVTSWFLSLIDKWLMFHSDCEMRSFIGDLLNKSVMSEHCNAVFKASHVFMREAFCVYACERLEACPSATCGSEIRVFL